ncbi:hypothetical protein BGX27_006160 [Mortierella sp. AM989]|nr:hypothetical protein BGX27_006160 [Mortierella sp. AM989]
MDNNQSNGNYRKPSFRNLQPRAAAAIDFNDSDEDDGPLSADYKAQRKTTMDLVDFFKNAPPPPPPAPCLPPVVPDEKKKRTLLQRLRSRKTSLTMGRDSLNRASVVIPSIRGTTSSINASSGGGEVATLPNGKKYIMIAVDYKNKDTDAVGAGMNTLPSTLSASAVRPPMSDSLNRLSINNPVENSGSKRSSILSSNPNFQVTTTIQEDRNVTGNNDSSKRSSLGSDRRRSIVIQAGGGEGSSFMLDDTPFLLDHFALDSDYITIPTATDNNLARQQPNGRSSSEASGSEYHRTHSPRSGHGQGTENGSKRGPKVTFNIEGQQHEEMSEDAVSKALADRIANHRAQISKGMLSEATANKFMNDSGFYEQANLPEIVLPKPISRKKVRHVQIQTQHCIMRPMYTQTEPIESLSQELESKEFGAQTVSEGSIDGSTDVGTSTDSESTAVTPTKASPTSKVANLVTSLNQPTATTAVYTKTSSKGTSTTTTTTIATSTGETRSLAINTTPLTSQEQEELIKLRHQNAALQTQVASLQRDLAAETRARTRTAVAMQDTRDKFEMLSAMAYKKLKEMITNRHILEMEVRELRAQVDIQAEESEVYNQQNQGYITVGLRY